LDRLARLPVDHPPVVLGDLLPQPRRRLRLEVAELVDSAALNRDAGPLRAQRRVEPGIPVDHREHGGPAGRERPRRRSRPATRRPTLARPGGDPAPRAPRWRARPASPGWAPARAA